MDDEPTESVVESIRKYPSVAQLRAVTKRHEIPFWISAIFYRKVSIYITWIFVRWRVSANAATGLSALAVLTAALLYALGSPAQPALWIVAAVLVQAYFILDHVDGELARYERHIGRTHAGMSGLFYDTCCHASDQALFGAVALRQFFDLDGPWWLAVIGVAFFFPGSIAPWQRYCETLVGYARQNAKEDRIELPAAYGRSSSLSVKSTAGETEPKRTTSRWLQQQIVQTIGFPGYLAGLSLCTILDVIPAMPRIHLMDQELPYLVLWLILRSLQASAASVKSTLNYGRRLRSLPG